MLRDYQKEAVRKIEEAIINKEKKIKIEMAVGTGRFFVLAAVLKLEVLQQKKVLVITASKTECEAIRKRLNLAEDAQINCDIATYTFALHYATNCVEYDLVVFDGIHYGKTYLQKIYESYVCAQFIGFTSVMGVDNEGIFANVQSVFSYSYAQASQEGQINRLNASDRIMKLVHRILLENGCTNIKSEVRNQCGDIEALFGDKVVFFDVRNYRDKYIENELVYSCVKRVNMKQIDNEKTEFVLIMFGLVDKLVKSKIRDEFKIIIWDIKNIKYLCLHNNSLGDELAECVR